MGIHPAVRRGDVSTRFSWPVWDYNLSKVRILEQGKGIFKDIAAIVESWPDGAAMPAPFDVKIVRQGTGQFDTKYTVTGVPQGGTMPLMKDLKDQLPDMAERSKGLPLKEIVAGQQPDVVKVGSGSPTLAALEAGDNAPDDLPEGDIDLDEIPF
ncbi:hypothetical protein [Pedococcus soli]